MGGGASAARGSWAAEDSVPRLDGKIAVITGANSGLGYHQARIFFLKGCHVVLACRNQGRGEDAAAKIMAQMPWDDKPVGKVEVMIVDTSEPESVKEFAKNARVKLSHIDILVNNAGVMAISKRQGNSKDWEMQIATNHFGHFILTAELLPLIAKAEAPRIVNVASSAQKFAPKAAKFLADINAQEKYSPWPQYGVTKLCNMLFTYELVLRLKSKYPKIIVVATHPGYTDTNLQNSDNIGFLKPVMNGLFAMRGEKGVMSQVYASCADDVQSGDYYGPRHLAFGPSALETKEAAAINDADALALWKLSVELTGCNYDGLERA